MDALRAVKACYCVVLTSLTMSLRLALLRLLDFRCFSAQVGAARLTRDGGVGAALGDAEFLGPLASFLLLTLVVLRALISGLLVLTADLLWPSLWPPLFHPKFW